MKPLTRHILMLFVLWAIVLLAGFLVTEKFGDVLKFSEVAVLSLFFVFIALVSLIIFFTGQTKKPESQTMHSLVSVGLKFLLELILIFVWFILAKKSGLSSVLSFFVIYLTFTLFLIFVMLKTLRNKSL